MASGNVQHTRIPAARSSARRRARWREAAAGGLGFMSALTGLAMTLPSAWSIYLLSRPGVLITEHPWLPIGTGLTAVMLARGRKRRFGGWLGVCGILMGARPLLHIQSVSRQHEALMADGLGQDYKAKILPETLKRATRTRLDIPGTSRRRQAAAQAVQVECNVPFYADDSCTLRLDVYQPPDRSDSLRPAVIAIHGGGWNGGDKGSYHVAKQRWLAQQGYVVFDIQYRLSPTHLWPTHLTDVKTAIRWVRGHADRFQIDPERIGLIGRSAGGHLALMAAFTPGDPAFPPIGDLPARDDVQAVVALYPPTDLPLLQETAVGTLSYWLGDTLKCNPDLYRAASPLHAANPNAPPVLLAHGGCDNLVTPEHSRRLHRRLCELGVSSVYLYYPWGRHGFDVSLSGLGGQMVQYDIERFLAVTLRKADL
ncbi:MAG: alpha/beta hydrolase fold domain-containing protein [Aggregatilineales bacterium]